MDIITPMQCFFAMGRDICPQVSLIGRLVGRETRIAVETISGVAHGDMRNGRVECGNPCDGLCDAFLKILFSGEVFCLVFLEPRAVVVGGDR